MSELTDPKLMELMRTSLVFIKGPADSLYQVATWVLKEMEGSGISIDPKDLDNTITFGDNTFSGRQIQGLQELLRNYIAQYESIFGGQE